MRFEMYYYIKTWRCLFFTIKWNEPEHNIFLTRASMRSDVHILLCVPLMVRVWLSLIQNHWKKLVQLWSSKKHLHLYHESIFIYRRKNTWRPRQSLFFTGSRFQNMYFHQSFWGIFWSPASSYFGIIPACLCLACAYRRRVMSYLIRFRT